jgi:peroxiredoxin (alkyl hydroperoxide reductase subunit C)
MKTTIKKITLFAIMFFGIAQVWPQKLNVNSRIPLLGEKAPKFTAQTTSGAIEFPGGYGNKWKILFSHPNDFTPVCTSELMELGLMQQDFKDLNVQLVVISTDSIDRHKLWIQSMEEMLIKIDKPVKIEFPFVDDSKLKIGWKYGMLTKSNESFKAVRGVFIIDPNNIVRSISFYPMNVGRNIEEIKRTVIALQTSEKYTVLMPADWEPGKDVLLPYPTAEHNEKSGVKGSEYYDLSWYMLYKKLDK